MRAGRRGARGSALRFDNLDPPGLPGRIALGSVKTAAPDELERRRIARARGKRSLETGGPMKRLGRTDRANLLPAQPPRPARCSSSARRGARGSANGFANRRRRTDGLAVGQVIDVGTEITVIQVFEDTLGLKPADGLDHLGGRDRHHGRRQGLSLGARSAAPARPSTACPLRSERHASPSGAPRSTRSEDSIPPTSSRPAYPPSTG